MQAERGAAVVLETGTTQGDQPRDGKLSPAPFVWVGNHLVADFHNTTVWSRAASPVHEAPIDGMDLLDTYVRLLDWSHAADLLSERDGAILRDEAVRYPDDAARVAARAIELRSIVHGVLVPVARALEADGSALAAMNLLLSDAMARVRVVSAGAGFRWEWSGASGCLERPLWPIVRSIAELLTSPDLMRIKECEGERCGFLFLDTSRRGRRWCDMSMCGNRAKSRRHYKRVRTQQA